MGFNWGNFLKAGPFPNFANFSGSGSIFNTASSAAPTTQMSQYSSMDPNNLYPAGTDPNRNKDNGLAYGLPFQLRSTWGAYPGVNAVNNILANPGQTDSLMVNRALAQSARGTQASQDSARASLARSGFGNSGLGAALQAAIAGQGSDQRANILTQEARRREDLMRSDLMDFLGRFYVDPKVQMYGANKGVQIANQQAATQKRGAEVGGAAALAGALIAAFACRTAEELYGVDADETKLARYYMGKMADDKTREAYGTGGALAERVKADPALRAKVKPIFDTFVEEARTALGA